MIEYKFKNKFANGVVSYDDMVYDTRITKFSDYMSNKYNIVHNEIYNNALKKLLNSVSKSIIGTNFLVQLFKASNEFYVKYEELDYSKFYEFIKNAKNFKDELSYPLLLENNYNILQEEFINECLKILVQHLDIVKNNLEEYDSLTGIDFFSTIDDFVIEYKNNVYILSEIETNDIFFNVNPETLVDGIFRSEEDENGEDYLIIMENYASSDIFIGYDENGKWYIKINKTVPTHKILKYIESMRKLIRTSHSNIIDTFISLWISYFKKSHKIIEIKGDEYYKPSSVIIVDKTLPYNKYTIDLSPYWNKYQKYEKRSIDNMMITNDISDYSTCEITWIDYVKGYAKVYSKFLDKEFEIPFEYLNPDMKISEEYSLSNTFTYKLNN